MLDDHKDTILRIYDTVADQALWPEVLDRFSHSINARGCIVFEQTGLDDDRRLHASLTTSGYSKALLRAYLKEFFEEESQDHQVFEAHSLERDEIDLVDDGVLADDDADLKRRPNVRRLMQFGIFHRAAGLLNKDNKRIGRFSVQLGADRGPLSGAERAQAAIVLPHIAKAIDLGRAAAQASRRELALLAAMDKLVIGIALLDGRGRIVATNEEFRRQQAEYAVFRVAPGGALHMRRADDEARFRALKEDARNHGKFGARPRKEAIAVDEGAALCVELAPLHASREMGTRPFDGSILFSIDTSLRLPLNTALLRDALCLTEAEFALVDSLAAGLTNPQIADMRGRSVATVNAQVKAILGKAQCSTRTQFVRLVMGFGFDYLARGEDEARTDFDPHRPNG